MFIGTPLAPVRGDAPGETGPPIRFAEFGGDRTLFLAFTQATPMDQFGRISSEYPHGYGYCQCGCGRVTKVLQTGGLDRYFDADHAASAKAPTKRIQPRRMGRIGAGQQSTIPPLTKGQTPAQNPYQDQGRDLIQDRFLESAAAVRRLELRVTQLTDAIQFALKLLDSERGGDDLLRNTLASRLKSVLAETQHLDDAPSSGQ